MHSYVTSKSVKWCHLIWPTLYIWKTLLMPVRGFSVLHTHSAAAHLG